MQVQWGSEHSSKITQHHTVKVYSDWELQSTVGVQTVLSAKWAATPGALLVIEWVSIQILVAGILYSSSKIFTYTHFGEMG